MSQGALPIAETAEVSPARQTAFSIREAISTCRKRHRTVLMTAATCAALGGILAFLKPNIYTAVAVILPPQNQSSSASALLSQIGTLAGGAGALTNMRTTGELYVGMLKSRTVQDDLVNKFHLLDYYQAKLQSSARTALEKDSAIQASKEGLIRIAVDNQSPEMAANIANGYVESLKKLLSSVAISEAAQRRQYYEKQLAEVREKLARTEAAAKQVLGSSGVTSVESQGKALMETAARLRSQLATQEVKVAAMRGYAAPGNPDLVKANQELAALKHQLASLEGRDAAPGKTEGSNVGLDNLRLLKDAKYYDTVYEALAKQYEIAKLDEAKEGAAIQVIDVAIAPDRKSKPQRLTILIGSFLAGLLLGCAVALVREFQSKKRNKI